MTFPRTVSEWILNSCGPFSSLFLNSQCYIPVFFSLINDYMSISMPFLFKLNNPKLFPLFSLHFLFLPLMSSPV